MRDISTEGHRNYSIYLRIGAERSAATYKTRAAVRGMTGQSVGKFITLTLGLTLGLAVSIAATFRADIARNWETKRCDPGVVPIAGLFKPDKDPRTAAQFASDNWDECRKEYVQSAIAAAAAVPKELAEAEQAVAGVAGDVADKIADIFVGIWKFCYEAYSTFIEDMKGTAKLFHNFLINLHQIVDRLQASALSIVYSLIALVVSVLNSVQLILIVAIVIIGILIALQIILFFLLLPISGLIITVTAIVSVAVVVIATAISAAMVAEMYTTEGCFVAGTPVVLATGQTRPIEQILLGDVLVDGGRVEAIHRFVTTTGMYEIDGIQVSGNHLIVDPSGNLTPVSESAAAHEVEHRSWFFGAIGGGAREIWCLTTSTRRIYCEGRSGATHVFADWEEIPESDCTTLRRWEAAVWSTLNPTASPDAAPTSYMTSEAALAPECMVQMVDWKGRRAWRPITDITVGMRIVENLAGDVTTVTGVVDLSPDLILSAVTLPSGEHGPQIVSMGSWIYGGVRAQPRQWDHPLDYREVVMSPRLRSRPWRHLYTASGRFMLSGGWAIRDAAEVGLERLDDLVEGLILGKPTASIGRS
jgi:hypothetical protein